ncbi:MAG: anti-sigma regulatory factor [Solirubrobacterales bacterium]
MGSSRGPNPTARPVTTDADVALCVVVAGRAAAAAGLSDGAAQSFTTAVSELARNILKFAGQGEIQIRELTRGGRRGVEATATDEGPGISDVKQAMSDNYSSAGTLGIGLPGTKRMMDEFEIDTAVDQGTTVTIRKWA